MALSISPLTPPSAPSQPGSSAQQKAQSRCSVISATTSRVRDEDFRLSLRYLENRPPGNQVRSRYDVRVAEGGLGWRLAGTLSQGIWSADTL
jgi:hypothetical protein